MTNTQTSGYFVYKHTNLFNGKVYIGITRRKKPSDRWGAKGSRYKYNEHFYRAIQKYGWDEGFSHEILFAELTAEEAKAKEMELIKLYNSYKYEFGYNNDLGGNGSNRILPETIEKLRAIHTGRTRPQSTRDNIRNALIGHEVTAETRRKISENSKKTALERSKAMKKMYEDGILGRNVWNKGIVFTQEQLDEYYQHRYRPVKCVETNRIYKSVKAASEELNINYTSIRKACSGKQKTAGGFHFEDISK